MLPLYDCFKDKWENIQTCYIIADTHFGDNNLREGIPNRPSDQELVKRINSKVGKKDMLIVLGDVGECEWVSQLRGYKVLVMGNHDLGKSNYQRKVYTKRFDITEYQRQEAIDEMRRLYPECHRITCVQDWDWECYADNCLFDEVYEGPLMIAEKLILSHEPLDLPWAFNLHGHVHTPGLTGGRNRFNCCCDVINYEPINLNQFLKTGVLSKVPSIHRLTIDKATNKKAKRTIADNK